MNDINKPQWWNQIKQFIFQDNAIIKTFEPLTRICIENRLLYLHDIVTLKKQYIILTDNYNTGCILEEEYITNKNDIGHKILVIGNEILKYNELSKKDNHSKISKIILGIEHDMTNNMYDSIFEQIVELHTYYRNEIIWKYGEHQQFQDYYKIFTLNSNECRSKQNFLSYDIYILLSKVVLEKEYFHKNTFFMDLKANHSNYIHENLISYQDAIKKVSNNLNYDVILGFIDNIKEINNKEASRFVNIFHALLNQYEKLEYSRIISGNTLEYIRLIGEFTKKLCDEIFAFFCAINTNITKNQSDDVLNHFKKLKIEIEDLIISQNLDEAFDLLISNIRNYDITYDFIDNAILLKSNYVELVKKELIGLVDTVAKTKLKASLLEFVNYIIKNI